VDNASSCSCFFPDTRASTRASSQAFDSGSTGTDGPLILTTPGTVLFDTSIVATRSNSARTDVYHFTSIYIGDGVTVKLSSSKLTGSVFWLSSGPVEINGVIDLNGDDGSPSPSSPGAGGYPGGQSAIPPTSRKDYSKRFSSCLSRVEWAATVVKHWVAVKVWRAPYASSASITVNGRLWPMAARRTVQRRQWRRHSNDCAGD